MDEPPDRLEANELCEMEWNILCALLEKDRKRWCSIEEVLHKSWNPIIALDALAKLYDAGLIHRHDRFIFATRAAAHFYNLAH